MAISKSKLKKIIPILLITLLVGGVYLFLHRNEESTDDAAIDGHNVLIAPKVSGYVKTINIKDNQFVKAGDEMLEIDASDYIIRKNHAEGVLEAAKAQEISATAALEKTKSSMKRMQRLSDQARSQEQLEQTTSEEQEALAKLEQTKAQVRQAEADRAQTEKDLADTKITAPMDGYITRKGVEIGDFVQSGQQLASLVGTDIWVIANFKETQLKYIKTGDAVDINIDAFPDVKLQGKVDSVQLGTGSYFSAFPAENATGNYVKLIQRVPVKIIFNNQPDIALHLGLGMSVVPVVHLGTAN